MLPEPSFYGLTGETLRWAQALQAHLEQPVQLAKLQPLNVAKLPTPNADGLTALALDALGGPAPVYSLGGIWLRYDTNVEVTT